MTNKTSDYDLTVIVPVYNERGNMLRLETALSTFLKKSKVKSCILFVNDGSQDGSGDLIREICRRNKDFFYIGLAKNCGLSAAMKAGIDYTCSRLVGYIDADLQTTPEDFNLLLEYTDDYELVMGIRVGRKDSLVKNMSSKVANGFRRLMTKDGVKDTGCPLKILHTEYAQRIPFFTGMHRFLPALILLQQGKVKQVVLQKMELGEPDASGRRSPVPIPGATETIDIDLAIVSVGVSPNPIVPSSIKGLELGRKGTIAVNDNMQSSIPTIFAGGDIVRGGATVILAMGDGRKAAAAMNEQLKK